MTKFFRTLEKLDFIRNADNEIVGVTFPDVNGKPETHDFTFAQIYAYSDKVRLPRLNVPRITSALIDSKKGEELILNRARAIAICAFYDVESERLYKAATTKKESNDAKRLVWRDYVGTLAAYEIHADTATIFHHIAKNAEPLKSAYDEKIARLLAAYMTPYVNSPASSAPLFFPDKSTLCAAFDVKTKTGKKAVGVAEWLASDEKPEKIKAVGQLHKAIFGGWTVESICNPMLDPLRIATKTGNKVASAQIVANFEKYAFASLRANRSSGKVDELTKGEFAFMNNVHLYAFAVLCDAETDKGRLETPAKPAKKAGAKAKKAEETAPTIAPPEVETPTETPAETM